MEEGQDGKDGKDGEAGVQGYGRGCERGANRVRKAQGARGRRREGAMEVSSRYSGHVGK